MDRRLQRAKILRQNREKKMGEREGETAREREKGERREERERERREENQEDGEDNASVSCNNQQVTRLSAPGWLYLDHTL